MGSVIMPFIGAAITAYLFNPLISWLHQRSRVGRGIWILVLYVVVGFLFYLLVQFLGPLLIRQYFELMAVAPGVINTLQQQLLLEQTITIGTLEINAAPVRCV